MSIYENTPAYCERAAHIAEKAMPICKDMAKLYLMFHEKTTTVFERRKNMKKILSFVYGICGYRKFYRQGDLRRKLSGCLYRCPQQNK